ncbi:MAG: HlyD family secretion protein [Saprospiraceae bacterium]|jgi:HlyD family secretion protein
MMDRKVEKKRWTKKSVLYILGFIVLLILSTLGFRSLNKKTYNLDQSKITVKEVKQGEFQDIILIDANVAPITSVLVNTPEGGTVEEVFIEDGVMVKKGTPLLKLNNPSLVLTYMTQETAIVEQINNLQNLKLSLEKDQRGLRESLIDIEYELSDKERDFKIDTLLFSDGIVAKNNFVDTYESYKYQQKKRDFLEENVNQSKTDNAIQIKRINRSIEMMDRNLEVIHENMKKLLVRAPVTGRLSSFDPVIGESFQGSQTIAKIDVMKGYKVTGQVDEYYLSSVKAGQSARFSFNGEIIELTVKKVLPEVINGRFEIEMTFVSETPKAITTGLSLQARLELSETSKAMIIPRGSFFNTFGGQYVFVLNNDNQAEKRKIRIGRQNPSHYEVLDGLMEGEKIITSSYEAFKNFETITITE